MHAWYLQRISSCHSVGGAYFIHESNYVQNTFILSKCFIHISRSPEERERERDELKIRLKYILYIYGILHHIHIKDKKKIIYEMLRKRKL